MDLVVTFFASFLIWVMILLLFLLVILKGKLKKEYVLHILISSLVAWVVSSFIKDLLPTVRPFQVNGYPSLTLTINFSSAFPSTHSAVAFALAASLYLHNKKLGSWYLLAAALIGLARVASHAHFLLDILGGASLGALVAVTLSKVHFGSISKRLPF